MRNERRGRAGARLVSRSDGVASRGSAFRIRSADSSKRQRMLEEGKQIFRFDTFGSEDFWGGKLRLHEALAGEKLGGVGHGCQPEDGSEPGPESRCRGAPRRPGRGRSKPARSISTIPATTAALLKLNAVVGVTGVLQSGWPAAVRRHPVRAVPFDRGRLVRARHRQAPRRVGQSRSEHRRDRGDRAESPAVQRPARRGRSDGQEGAQQLGAWPLRRRTEHGWQGQAARRQDAPRR